MNVRELKTALNAPGADDDHEVWMAVHRPDLGAECWSHHPVTFHEPREHDARLILISRPEPDVEVTGGVDLDTT